MEKSTLKLVVLLFISSYLVQGLMARLLQENEIEKQLLSINKPFVKSFQTKYGDIFDCVEIRKQPAFDHPLLRNHSIQMKPAKGLLEPMKSSNNKFTIKNLLQENIRCPKGTVLIKRVTKEDLSPTKSSKFNVAQGFEVAYLIMRGKNTGVHANINLWQPDVAANQFSSGSIFVESGDGSNVNTIAAGWSVNSDLYQNSSRLYMLWTRDSGKTTGCYNILCPGFVQVSQELTPGLVLQPLSTYDGSQYEIILRIKQDPSTGNWWVNLQDKDIGYYPKELFTTLGGGGDEVGWGGEIGSPTTQPFPAMGSGNFPEDGFKKAAYIDQMTMYDYPSGGEVYPTINTLAKIESKSKCYRALYVGDSGGKGGRYMFFGGPSGCSF